MSAVERPAGYAEEKSTLDKVKEALLRWSIIGGLTAGGIALGVSVENYKKPKGLVEDPRLERFSEDIDTTGLFYKYAVVNDEATKLYDTDYVYFIYDKDDYTCHEYLSRPILFKDASVIYDLESDRLLAYREFLDGEDINYQYYLDYGDDNYYVPLTEASNYVEGLEVKDYYSLDEIRELETEIGEGFKVLSKVQ